MPRGLDEERARVILYLPVSRSGERKAYSEIIVYLTNNKQTPQSRITGFTHTTIFPSPYHGYWWNNRKNQQGESLAYVKEQMGHHSIQLTVDTYGHLVPGGNRQAVDRLDDPVPLPARNPREREGGATIRNLYATTTLNPVLETQEPLSSHRLS